MYRILTVFDGDKYNRQMRPRLLIQDLKPGVHLYTSV